MDRPKSRLVPVLIVTGFLLFASYVAGYYFGMCEHAEARNKIDRMYRARWQATLFIPAAIVEAKARGMHVGVGFGNQIDGFDMIFTWQG